MDRYLFTDGTGGVKEVQSKEELNALVHSAPKPEKIKIWAFNTHEWVSYADFLKSRPGSSKKEEIFVPVTEPRTSLSRTTGRPWLKKFLLFSFSGAAVFLVYNFTRVKWKKVTPLVITAGHPANVPVMDADSMIQSLEITRGIKLDKTTRTNLRIRNTWPDRIILQVHAERDTSNAGTRFYNIELNIDNTTGYNIDNAVVQLTSWKGHIKNSSDTFHFNNISYALAAKRIIGSVYRGDSLSVSFKNIKAKSFNFCYSEDKKSNYGSAIDRWFCRE